VIGRKKNVVAYPNLDAVTPRIGQDCYPIAEPLMKQWRQRHQIVAISHLPQLPAKGGHSLFCLFFLFSKDNSFKQNDHHIREAGRN